MKFDGSILIFRSWESSSRFPDLEAHAETAKFHHFFNLDKEAPET